MWLLRAGVQPNVKTYTTLMSACTRAGEWERALDAFQMMEAAGLEADVMAYNSAISACAATGAWDVAWAHFGSASPTHLPIRSAFSCSETIAATDVSLPKCGQLQFCIRRSILHHAAFHLLQQSHTDSGVGSITKLTLCTAQL